MEQYVPDISSTLLGSLDYPKLDSLADCQNQLEAWLAAFSELRRGQNLGQPMWIVIQDFNRELDGDHPVSPYRNGIFSNCDFTSDEVQEVIDEDDEAVAGELDFNRKLLDGDHFVWPCPNEMLSKCDFTRDEVQEVVVGCNDETVAGELAKKWICKLLGKTPETLSPGHSQNLDTPLKALRVFCSIFCFNLLSFSNLGPGRHGRWPEVEDEGIKVGLEGYAFKEKTFPEDHMELELRKWSLMRV